MCNSRIEREPWCVNCYWNEILPYLSYLISAAINFHVLNQTYLTLLSYGNFSSSNSFIAFTSQQPKLVVMRVLMKQLNINCQSNDSSAWLEASLIKLRCEHHAMQLRCMYSKSWREEKRDTPKLMQKVMLHCTPR